MIEKERSSKPIYWWGLLGIIPFVGVIVGVVLILNGLYKRKDKILFLIGVLCVFWTFGIYYFYFLKLVNHPIAFGEGKEAIAQFELNTLAKEIELFKLNLGRYPNNLLELENEMKNSGEIIITNDPFKFPIKENNDSGYFNYQLIGDKYKLFSIGKDQIANTQDDIYPSLKSDTN